MHGIDGKTNQEQGTWEYGFTVVSQIEVLTYPQGACTLAKELPRKSYSLRLWDR